MTTHKILVIDDSRMIRRTVRDMLPNSFEVLEAEDGVEGLNLISKENPNLIMLDFILPKKGGLEVYQDLQKQPKLKAIPLVLMSGRKDEVTGKIPESAFKYCAFIEKPFDQKQLITGIKEAMEKAKLIPKPPESSLPKEQDSQGSQAMAAEIQQLKAKMAKMQSEINALKKQMSQLVKVVQQKMR